MATSGHILIIDDEPGLRQTFTRILRNAGWEVTTAENGPEGLQRLTGSAFDLVYLDIHLPGGMDGLQVLQEVHRQLPQLPVVLFTGRASLQTAVEAIRLGAIDYLTKPVDPETLIARTREILAGQATEKRRQEIHAQLASLQAELQRLDSPAAAAPAPRPAAEGVDRFLKRGTLILDLHARRSTFGDRALNLPPAAFDYLVVLARHAPDVVEYQTLVGEAQGYESDWRQAQELAKWHIHELRDELEPDPRTPRHVLNVRGQGYRLVVD